MPLKHLTETILVVLLALVILVTGVIVSVLPAIPEGFVPWAIVFLFAVIYPALLYPLLKTNRADYAFRALHFAPVGIALGWFIIQAATLRFPSAIIALRVYTWGWSALPVAVAFFLLMLFCLEVIRRRVPRLSFLLVLFAPFLALAYTGEQYPQWNGQLASVLGFSQSSIQIAMQGSSSSKLSASSKGEKNLSTSSVPEEEAWRKKLRSVESSSAHPITVAAPLEGINAVTRLTAAPGPSTGTGKRIVARPRRKYLPKSGGEFEAMIIVFAAMYAGTVHLKAKRRMA